MSYMRGDNYIWRDDQQVHLWIRDGYDFWDEAVWTGDNTESDSNSAERRPSGVAVHQEVMDEYVVMRFAELLEDAIAAKIIDRALAAHGGNGGCGALANRAPALRALLAAG